jgi:hypothetical protein
MVQKKLASLDVYAITPYKTAKAPNNLKFFFRLIKSLSSKPFIL